MPEITTRRPRRRNSNFAARMALRAHQCHRILGLRLNSLQNYSDSRILRSILRKIRHSRQENSAHPHSNTLEIDSTCQGSTMNQEMQQPPNQSKKNAAIPSLGERAVAPREHGQEKHNVILIARIGRASELSARRRRGQTRDVFAPHHPNGERAGKYKGNHKRNAAAVFSEAATNERAAYRDSCGETR